MDWDKVVQLTVNGLTGGAVYALVALGFSMVYGILKLLNLAHGDVLMVGAFIGWGVLGWLGGAQDPSVAVWLLIVLMVLGAFTAYGAGKAADDIRQAMGEAAALVRAGLAMIPPMCGSGSPFTVAGSVSSTELSPEGVIRMIRKSPAGPDG